VADAGDVEAFLLPLEVGEDSQESDEGKEGLNRMGQYLLGVLCFMTASIPNLAHRRGKTPALKGILPNIYRILRPICFPRPILMDKFPGSHDAQADGKDHGQSME
jgi:hypothetical protein